jgi:hypothetical protein
MPIVRCPSCEKSLSLDDRYLGKQVRCPACKAIFSVPVSDPAPAPAPKRPAPAPPPPTAPSEPASPFDFGGTNDRNDRNEEDDTGGRRRRRSTSDEGEAEDDERRAALRAKVKETGKWLGWSLMLAWAQVVLYLIALFVRLVLGGPNLGALCGTVIGVAIAVPSVVLFGKGINAFLRMNSSGMATLAAVLALMFGVFSGLAFLCSGVLVFAAADDALIGLAAFLGLLSLPQAVLGTMSGIKALKVLSSPEAKKKFAESR